MRETGDNTSEDRDENKVNLGLYKTIYTNTTSSNKASLPPSLTQDIGGAFFGGIEPKKFRTAEHQAHGKQQREQ